jgi:hypothetical protein
MNEDQRAAWRKALAAHAKAARTQHGKRKRGLAAVTRAGMVRVSPASTREGTLWGSSRARSGPR